MSTSICTKSFEEFEIRTLFQNYYGSNCEVSVCEASLNLPEDNSGDEPADGESRFAASLSFFLVGLLFRRDLKRAPGWRKFPVEQSSTYPEYFRKVPAGSRFAAYARALESPDRGPAGLFRELQKIVHRESAPPAFAIFELADAARRAGMGAWAKSLLDEALEKEPLYVEAMAALANWHAEEASKGYSDNSDNSDNYDHSASRDAALAFADLAICSNPLDLDAVFVRVRVLKDLGDFAAAMEALREALAKRRNFVGLYIAALEIAAVTGTYFTCFEDAIRAHPKDAVACLAAAEPVALEMLGERELCGFYRQFALAEYSVAASTIAGKKAYKMFERAAAKASRAIFLAGPGFPAPLLEICHREHKACVDAASQVFDNAFWPGLA